MLAVFNVKDKMEPQGISIARKEGAKTRVFRGLLTKLGRQRKSHPTRQKSARHRREIPHTEARCKEEAATHAKGWSGPRQGDSGRRCLKHSGATADFSRAVLEREWMGTHCSGLGRQSWRPSSLSALGREFRESWHQYILEPRNPKREYLISKD